MEVTPLQFSLKLIQLMAHPMVHHLKKTPFPACLRHEPERLRPPPLIPAIDVLHVNHRDVGVVVVGRGGVLMMTNLREIDLWSIVVIISGSLGLGLYETFRDCG